MSDLASLPLNLLRRMLADPRNAAVKSALQVEIARRGTLGLEPGSAGAVNTEKLSSGAGPLVVLEAPAVEAVGTARKTSAPRRVTGQPNQTESAFAAEVLEPWRLAGGLERYLFERLAFLLPEVGSYRPDYVAFLPGGELWAFEVKGPQVWEDSRKTFKIAAREYPWIRWTMVQRKGRGKPWRVLYDRGAQHGGDVLTAITLHKEG